MNEKTESKYPRIIWEGYAGDNERFRIVETSENICIERFVKDKMENDSWVVLSDDMHGERYMSIIFTALIEIRFGEKFYI